MGDKNYYYYDIQIMNNSGSDDYQLIWEDARNNNIIPYNKSNKYSMMVNELILDTDGILLFRFKPNKYQIKVTNTDTSSTNSQYLVFNVNIDSIYPTKEDYRREGIYYIYQFLRILNRALILALQGAGYVGTEAIFLYNPKDQLFYISRTTTVTTLNIQLNSDLSYLFNGLFMEKIDGTYWRIIMDDTINLSEQVGGRNIYTAEYSSTDNWRQVTSINLYMTNNLHITNSLTYTYDYNQLNYSQNKERSQLLLKVFYPEFNDVNNRIKLFFQNSNYPVCLKNVESRAITPNSFSQLSFKMMLEMSTGEEYPIYLDKTSHLLGEIVIEETLNVY